MLTIDGSYGEGGGQILRTSVAFSALTKKPIKIINIRKKRENPGLKAQHLNAVKSIASLCDAEVRNLTLNSMEIEFIPKEISDKKFFVDIGTAGSISLVLQALFISSIFNNIEVKIIGGTDVEHAPSIDYVKNVLLPILNFFGIKVELEILQRGYYPKGNGIVNVKIYKTENLKSINLTEKGKILEIYGISHSSLQLKSRNVAERQKFSAEKILRKFLNKFNHNIPINIKVEYCKTLSAGSGITLIARTENSFFGSCTLGKIGKTSESVGEECAKNLISELERGGAVDSYMSDQIIPYIALAKGKVKINELTMHAKTNLHIVNLFGFNVKVEGNLIYY